MIHKKENGYILITVLLMLLVLTVIGLAAIGTSTVENLIAGNTRLKEGNREPADGCNVISTRIIDRAVMNMDTFGFSNLVTDGGLATELRSGDFHPDGFTDVRCKNSLLQLVDVDIDKMYRKRIEGSAVEFASGYEGMGKGGANSNYFYYRINSRGNSMMNAVLNSSATVGTVYRYMPK